MPKRKQNESTGSDTVPNQDHPAEQGQTELPLVESPPISPAKQETAPEPAAVEALAVTAASPAAESGSQPVQEEATHSSTGETPAAALTRWPRLKLRPRHKRYAMLAASVAIAAAVGAMVGAATTGGFSKPAPVSVVGLDESKAAQQSIARLSKEITNLKASLEAANKSAHSEFAKISERLTREGAEMTGAITSPQTVPPTPPASAPVPPSRPASAAAEAPRRPSIITNWTIRETRDGFVYVQGHGEIYQVVPGAPLPGLGPVEQIRRQDGRWVVVTPKGIIVSMRDRRYFEQF